MEPNMQNMQPGQVFVGPGMPQPTPPQMQPPIQNPKKPRKKLFVAAAALSVLLLATGFVGWWFVLRGEGPGGKAPTLSNAELAEQYTLQLIDKAKELKASPDEAPTLAKELKAVAEERQDAMLSLLQEDTAKFMMLAEPTGFVDLLPEDVAATTERSAEVEGLLEVVHGEKVNDKKKYGEDGFLEAFYEYYVQDQKGKVRVHFDEEVSPSFYNKKVRVKGIKLDNNVAAQISNMQLAGGESEESVLAATTEKKVAVILFNFKANTSKPWTADQVRNSVFVASNSPDAYYRQVSFNNLGLSGISNVEGDVFGWYTISNSNTTCDYNAWLSAAKTAAINAGKNLSGYTNIIYGFPWTAICGWAGIGWIGGSDTMINGYLTTTGVVTHELGHNFGAHHSSTWNCKSSTGARVAISDSCTLDEYGDKFDVMGNGLYHFNNFQKGRANFYRYSSNTIIAPVGTNQYKVLPIETATSGLQSLRVPKDIDSTGKVIDYYYIEDRKVYGFDNFSSTSPVITGATIRVGRDYSVIDRPRLLDMTPATTSFLDAQLLVGKEFYDSKRGIRIKVISSDSTGTTVQVTRPQPPCGRAYPSVSITPTSQWGYPGNTLSYTMTVTNKDASTCSASTFGIAGSLPSGFTQSLSATSLSLAPGASGSVTVKVTAGSSMTSGAYSFKETVTNNSATTYKTTVTGAFNIYDQNTTPPVVTITSPSDGEKIGSRDKITATASSKSGISKIQLYINNSLVKTVTGTTKIDYNFNTRKENSSTFNIVVRAYDNNGLSGTTTITVYK